MRNRGLSLLEVVVGLCLIALVVPFLLNLIPGGYLASFRAEIIQTGTTGALEWTEQARRKPKARNEKVVLNKIEFQASTEIFPVTDTNLIDIVVTFVPPRGAPIVLCTRVSSGD